MIISDLWMHITVMLDSRRRPSLELPYYRAIFPNDEGTGGPKPLQGGIVDSGPNPRLYYYRMYDHFNLPIATFVLVSREPSATTDLRY